MPHLERMPHRVILMSAAKDLPSIALPQAETVGAAVEEIRRRGKGVGHLYAVDAEARPTGVVSMRDLLLSRPETPIARVTAGPPATRCAPGNRFAARRRHPPSRRARRSPAATRPRPSRTRVPRRAAAASAPAARAASTRPRPPRRRPARPGRGGNRSRRRARAARRRTSPAVCAPAPPTPTDRPQPPPATSYRARPPNRWRRAQSRPPATARPPGRRRRRRASRRWPSVPARRRPVYSSSVSFALCLLSRSRGRTNVE